MAPNDHFSSHHGPPPGQGHETRDRFFDRIRSAGIVRPDQKVLAGVCGAVAQRMRVDVKAIRIGWAIAMITPLGALGLLLYLVGWLLIPQTDGRIVAEEILRGQSRHALFVVALVLFVGMPIVASTDGPPVGLFIGLVLAGFFGWLWWSKKGCKGHGSNGVSGRDDRTQNAPADLPGGQPVQPPAQSAGPDLIKRDPAQAGPPEFRPTAYDPQLHRSESAPGDYGPVPAWQGSQPSAQDGGDGSAARTDDDAEDWEDGQPPPYINPMTGPKDTDDWRASYQSPAPARPEAAAEATPVPVQPAPVAVKTARRRPPGVRVVLATAGIALVASAVTLLLRQPETFEQGAFIVGLVFLVVTGFVTLLVGLTGRRSGGLVALAIPALIVTGSSQGVADDVRASMNNARDGSRIVKFDDESWSPRVAELNGGAPYQARFGSGTLNLQSAAQLTAGEQAEVSVESAFGSFEVFVPEGVGVKVLDDESFGDVNVPDHLKDRPAEGDQGLLVINAEARFGSVDIKEAK